MAIVAGWGRIKWGGPSSNFLRKVNVTVTDNAACNSSYGGKITDNMICASDANKDSCSGDSGGPLMCRQNDKLVLCGVVSWGTGCAYKNFPGVYVRTTGMQFCTLDIILKTKLIHGESPFQKVFFQI